MITLASIALVAGVVGLELHGAHPVGPRPGRWYPLVASGANEGPVTFHSDSGSVRWTGTVGAEARVEGAVLPWPGDATAYARVGAALAVSLALPPPPAGPVLLGVGLSGDERDWAAASGWVVFPVEPASLADLDPFHLDLADLVLFGERAPSLLGGGPAAVERCLGAGVPVAVGESAARELFAGHPPPGLRRMGDGAREKEPPLRIRAGAAPPRTVAISGLEGRVGAFLLGPAALVLLAPLLRGRAGGRGALVALLAGGIVLTIVGGTVPLARTSEIRLAILEPASGATRVERVLFDGGTREFLLPPGAGVWPGRESDRLEVERRAEGTRFRVSGAARVSGTEPSPIRVATLEAEGASFLLDPIGPGCLVRGGRLEGVAGPLARGDRIPPTVDRERARPSRRLRALLDLIEPPRGEVFLAEVPSPGGPATFLLARIGGD